VNISLFSSIDWIDGLTEKRWVRQADVKVSIVKSIDYSRHIETPFQYTIYSSFLFMETDI
jgi:hypothetical protein